jgi:sortase A
MPGPPQTPAISRGLRLLLHTERVLIIAGCAALLWCAALVVEAFVAQRLARSSLEAAAVVEPPTWAVSSSPATAGGGETPLAPGSAIGLLSAPRVDLSAVVLQGSDAQTLRRGPGHLENTALPGGAGNVVIAGHRDSFFWPLRNIQLGDDIFLDTRERRFHYRVQSVRVVTPRDLSVLAATPDAVLTLITCYPFWVFGNAPERFVVRAVAVDDPGAAAASSGLSGSAATAVAPAAAAAPEAAAATGRAASDDQVLVRLAVERYRLMYNGRLISRNETSARVLTFETCDVTVDGDRATAVCQSGSRYSSAPERADRTFSLDRAAGGWAIKSIVVN